MAKVATTKPRKVRTVKVGEYSYAHVYVVRTKKGTAKKVFKQRKGRPRASQ